MRKYAIVLLVAILCLVGCTPLEPALSVALESPKNGETVSSLTPILAWTSSGGATSFRVQVATNADFGNLIIDEANLTGPSYAIPSGKLSSGQSYYWRVNASKGSQTSSWSSYWIFQTGGTTDTIMVNATLNGSPWSGAINYTLTGPKANSGSSVPKTFSNLATGSYTIGYSSGGPSGATFDGITPSATQTLSDGGTITFTLNFRSQAVNTILVNAILDGATWSGIVNFTIHGPQSGSSSSIPETFSSLPEGTYTVGYRSGGPAGATLSSISPSPSQTLNAGGTITFTLNFHKTNPSSTIYVNATLDGEPYSGRVKYDIDGPREDSSTNIPDSFSGMPSGTYTITYRSGRPVDAKLTSITPQPTQTLYSGGTITFTLNFSTKATGIIKIRATLDGAEWSGNIRCGISGPEVDSCYKVPYSFGNLPAGTYTVTYRSGGPNGATLLSISPQPTQTLSADETITFTLNFHSQASGTIMVQATLDGSPWQTAPGSGTIHYTIHGPSSDSSQTVPDTFTDLAPGTYTLTYDSGGPIGAELTNISPAPSLTLSSSGTITFTLNFHSQPRGTVSVRATFNGESWSGYVQYTLAGPYVDSDNEVPKTFNNCPPGNYTLSYVSGGPENSVLDSISPAPTQTLAADGSIEFVMNFLPLLR